MRRLLTYIVDKTLSGQVEQLKEIVVAKEVFERTLETGDTIVRVAANNLRKCLLQFYDTADGQEEPIRIGIPGPGYIASFAAVGPSLTTRNGHAKEHLPELKKGNVVPGREQWELTTLLASAEGSAVWLCIHTKTGAEHVFKFAYNELRLLRLRREVAVSLLLSRLAGSEPHFVPALEWNFDTAPYFIESEYYGQNLEKWSETREGFEQIPLEQRLQVLASTALAIAAAHNVGVVHKDLKPANILVDACGKVRVTDFDLASLDDASRLDALRITNPGFELTDENKSAAGTLLYLSPEVLKGQAPTAASDVYALGIILYQLACCNFRNKLSPGWEVEISDPLIREDIQAAANSSPVLRPSAAALAAQLLSFEQRRKQIRELEHIRQRAEVAEKQLAAAKARRPWIATSVVTLAFGCLVSTWLLYRVSIEKNRADREAATQVALHRFVSDSILGRTNPFLNSATKETLEEAVMAASPDIDKQFRADPATAASLHGELARDLEARSNFSEAKREYTRAIELFEHSEGAISEGALAAKFRLAAMQAHMYKPGTLDEARKLVADGESVLSRSSLTPNSDLQVWRRTARGTIAFVESNPQKAAHEYSEAVSAAEKIDGFNKTTLRTLKTFWIQADLRLPGGASAGEKLCRQLLREMAQEGEAESNPALRLRIILVQCLFVQGKHREVLSEADAVYPAIMSKLGAQSEVTRTLLGSRAAAAGHLGLWDRAIKDDMSIYKTVVQTPDSSSFFAVGALSDAGLSQCRSGQLTEGEANTRKAFEISKPLAKETGLSDATSYALAYCLILEDKINEADQRLRGINVQAVVNLSGEPSVAGDIALAQAEIALKRGDYALADQYSRQTEHAFENLKIDDFDRHELEQLQTAIHKRSLVAVN